MSREDLVRNFSLGRVLRNPAVFDREKLDWMNGVYIRQASAGDWARTVAERLEADLPPEVPRPVDRALVARVAPLVQERVKRLDELASMLEFFFVPPGPRDESLLLGKRFREDAAAARAALEAAEAALAAAPEWSAGALEPLLRATAERLELKAGDFFMLLRVAVTGRAVTPPLLESMEALGRDESLGRIREVM
jgi:glutamyl-tRNA synthetase